MSEKEKKESTPATEKEAGWAMTDYMRTYLFAAGKQEAYDWPDHVVRAVYAMLPDPTEVGYSDYLEWLSALGLQDPKWEAEVQKVKDDAIAKQNEQALAMAKLADKAVGGGALITEG